jgi:hypothetical protein
MTARIGLMHTVRRILKFLRLLAGLNLLLALIGAVSDHDPSYGDDGLVICDQGLITI